MGKSVLVSRLLLLLSGGLSFLLFWFGSIVLRVPEQRRLDGSLLQQSSPATAIGVTAVLLLAGTLIGRLLGGGRRGAGLFAAAAGLIALSLRGGTARQVLLAASGPSVYITLLGEVLILFAILLFCRGLEGLLLSQSRFSEPGETTSRAELPDTEWTALGVNVAIIAFLTVLLARTDQKGQVLPAVFLACCMGTVLTRILLTLRGEAGAWLTPLIVAVIGYGLAYVEPADWVIGRIDQPLARPLPLDYASAGTAGAVIGSWLTRRRPERVEAPRQPDFRPPAEFV